jgi:3-deoxy-manno-octulosonate cytidylyltransferase (CMP-KDO synthetase)
VPKVITVIPSRYASKRFPGKPLAILGGLPIIVRVYQQAAKATTVNEVYVATDDKRIGEAVSSHGGKVIYTDGSYVCGSDRIAAAIKGIDADYVINLQGDEPLIKPETIDSVAGVLIDSPAEVMSTACSVMENYQQADNPNVVKVVLSKDGHALYFSRSRIPFWSAYDKANPRPEIFQPVYRHIGIYGFTAEFIRKFAGWSRSPLEIAENLEQLRALENGYLIKCVVSEQEFLGIDTPEDLPAAEKRLALLK